MSSRKLTPNCGLRAVAAVFLCCGVGFSQPTTRPASDPILDQIKTLPTSKAVPILLRAITQSPENASYWGALAMASEAFPNFADYASQRALALKPGAPELLVIRACVLDGGWVGYRKAALDVLLQLKRIPGQQAYARDLEQLVSLSIPIPADFNSSYLFTGWAERLLALDRGQEADLVLERGFKLAPGEGYKNIITLLSLRAMALALADEPREAIKCFEASGRRLIGISSAWAGLPDIFVYQKRPDFAIEILDNLDFDRLAEASKDHVGEDEFIRYSALKSVLAWAYVQNEQLDRASELAANDKLLLLNILQRAGEEQKARDVGRAIIAPYLEPRQGNFHGPLLSFFPGARSLEEPYRDSVRRLYKMFPEDKQRISFFLGDPDTATVRHFGFDDVMLASERIAKLETTLKLKNPDAVGVGLRRELRDACAHAGRLQEAIALAASDAVDGGYDWSILRRRMDAENLVRTDPIKLIRAMQLLGHLGEPWGPQAVDGAGMDASEVVKELTALGPGILDLVIHVYGHNALSNLDAKPRLAVIRNTGDKQDIPILISAMFTRASYAAANMQKDEESISDIDECAQSLARVDLPPSAKNSERIQFWVDWWRKNAARIVGTDATPRPTSAP